MPQFTKVYFTSSMFNMFRTLIHPSSGGCDRSLPHGYHHNQPHRNSNTHWNKNTQPMWWYNRKVAGSWWWMYWCPKHVEHRRSEINLSKLWHQVGLLFFNYHNDARSNIHKIYWWIMLNIFFNIAQEQDNVYSFHREDFEDQIFCLTSVIPCALTRSVLILVPLLQ